MVILRRDLVVPFAVLLGAVIIPGTLSAETKETREVAASPAQVAFTITTSAATTRTADHQTSFRLDHPLLNGDARAVIVVTQVRQYTGQFRCTPSVFLSAYVGPGQWSIECGAEVPPTEPPLTFNVVVMKPAP